MHLRDEIDKLKRHFKLFITTQGVVSVDMRSVLLALQDGTLVQLKEIECYWLLESLKALSHKTEVQNVLLTALEGLWLAKRNGYEPPHFISEMISELYR